MNNKYFLLRHGQTIYQKDPEKKNILYPVENPPAGGPPVELTEEGKKQIKKAALELKNRGIGLIFSSDFYRTRQTSGIVVKELGLEVSFDKRLRDLNVGIFHGRNKNDYLNFFSDIRERFLKRPPEGENWQDVKDRLADFLKEVEEKYQNKTILIISHGDPLWLLEGMIRGFTTDEEFLKIRIKEVYPDPGQLIEIK